MEPERDAPEVRPGLLAVRGAMTQGSWFSYLPRHVGGGCREIRTERGRTHGGYYGTSLAVTSGLSNDLEDAANARAIAAVPELLDVLERARDVLLDFSPGTTGMNIGHLEALAAAVDAALAK